MHVHIATVGSSPEPVKKALNAIPGVDRVYLLFSEKFKENAEILSSELITGSMVDVKLMQTSAFDFEEIVSNIYKIYTDEFDKGVKFSINITGGTNLMAAAACSSAFFVGATIYYVLYDREKDMHDQLVTIPTPKTPNLESLGKESKAVLRKILELTDKPGAKLSSAQLTASLGQERALVWHHLHRLEKEELIEITKGMEVNGKVDKRASEVKLTQQGRLIARWN